MIYYIMGVSGSGKSTIGQILADELKLPFYDGDDYHPKSNITKMSKGIPLDDTDREGWLNTLNKLALDNEKQKGAIIVCSALKKYYRDLLVENLEDKYEFIYLKGDITSIKNRLAKRKDHFMPQNLLQSQFDTLEEPDNAIVVSIDQTPEDLVKEINNQIKKNII